MAQSLELLLIQFLMPDNDARRQAEEQIKRLAKDPQKITGHWAKLSPQLRHLVKQSLIESITMEHSPPVRRASANVVSIVAKYAVPAGEWPDLLPFLFQCSQSAQEDHREVALILFSSLTETIGIAFRPHFADLQALLLKCLQDETSNRVRVAALKAVGSFLEFTQDGAEVVSLYFVSYGSAYLTSTLLILALLVFINFFTSSIENLVTMLLIKDSSQMAPLWLSSHNLGSHYLYSLSPSQITLSLFLGAIASLTKNPTLTLCQLNWEGYCGEQSFKNTLSNSSAQENPYFKNTVKFREFIPSILNVSRQCLASGEEDVAIIAFEIFDELIESPAPLLGDSVKSIVQFSLDVCSSQNLESNTRHQAIQIISWLAKYKSNSLKKHKLVIPILQVMCPLLAESANGDEDDDLAPDRAAAEVIDTMALNLSKHMFPPVFEFASLSSQSANPKYREASATVLGVISEGCLDLMKDKLEPILHIVLGALRDPEQMVRGAASFALGQFAEHLQPEIVSHYESVLPCILNALEDASDEVKEKSYYALAAFCENMGEEILPFLDPLIEKLLAALQNSPRNLQETCMSAIGSVAAAAEQAFVPYAERVLELMKNFMVLTNDEDLRSRARATELVGMVAMSVGRIKMEPILPPFIEAAISGFALEFSELREYTHGFFSNLAEIMDDSFTQYLPHVVPLAFSSCNLDDGSAVDIDESDDENINGFGGVSSDDEAHDEPRVRNISIRTGVLDEKAAATQALGLFALHTKGSYAPYLEESLKILVRHSGYFHEDVRLQAIIALKYITMIIARTVLPTACFENINPIGAPPLLNLIHQEIRKTQNFVQTKLPKRAKISVSMISSTLGGLEMALNIATMISKHPSHPKLLGLSKEHPSKSSLSEHWRAFYLLTSLQLSFWTLYGDPNLGVLAASQQLEPDMLTAAEAVFQGHNEGPAKAKEIIDTVMNIYIKTMTEDDDKEVVAQACMSTAEIIKDFGYMAVEPYMPQLVEATLVLLREESACQQQESDSDIDDNDTEHDEVLMDAVSDLLPAFAKSMGPHFAPTFATLFNPLMKFAKSSRPPQDRTMVVACLAEVAQDMGAPIAGYVDALMPLVLKELASSEATNRRNAAFCVGELCKNGGESTLKYYGDILRGLYPLFGESEPDDAVRDNAAGAVARMIMVHPEAIPLNQVLPVFLKVLPLKEDREESIAVFTCVCNLVVASNPQILALVPDLVNLFAQVAASPVETSEVKAQVGRAFSHLISLYGHQMQPLLSNLSPVHANALAAFAPKS
ncbi:Importin-4 [Vitis vinifera]|uniref:Importin-4 n=1 Tax=Vitis vinifera TaxID=29760 RepID=A0A438E780_VITVI|nr:Importin-4 [Vitis vinifera]